MTRLPKEDQAKRRAVEDQAGAVESRQEKPAYASRSLLRLEDFDLNGSRTLISRCGSF